MIFITGGMAQGKTTFAESLGVPIIDDLHCKIKEWMKQGIIEEQHIIYEIEEEIRRNCEMNQEQSVWEAQVVLISREIGCGIVPIDKQESLWRELNGRVSCEMASQATEVYKMETGIAVKIK